MVVLVLAQRGQSRVGGGRCPFFSSSCLSLILSLMRIKKMGAIVGGREMRRDPYMKSLPSSKSHSRVIIFAFCPKSYQNLNPEDFGPFAVKPYILVALLVLRKFHLGDADVDCWWWRCRCW